MKLGDVKALKDFRDNLENNEVNKLNKNEQRNNLHNSYDRNNQINKSDVQIIKRGDIYFVELNGIVDICGKSVQQGYRPYVIISNDINNKFAPTVEVAPISSRIYKKLPPHVVIEISELDKMSMVLTEQIVTINKSKLLRKIGKCPERVIKNIDITLIKQMGINIDADLIQQIGFKQEVDWEHISDLVSTIKRAENSIRKYPENKAFQTMKRGLMKSLEKESIVCNISVNELMSMYDVNGKRINEVVIM